MEARRPELVTVDLGKESDFMSLSFCIWEIRGVLTVKISSAAESS